VGEIRVTIVGDSRVFREVFDAMKICIQQYNEMEGTDHTLGEVVIQEGIGGVDRFATPDILLSTLRVGTVGHQQLTLKPIALIMKSAKGAMSQRIFLIDLVEDRDHREKVRQFFHMAGLSEQLYFCSSLDQEQVDKYRIAIFSHLLTLLEELDG
jgi:hypothetical protein